MAADLSREIKRKAFHLLTLVYLGIYLHWDLGESLFLLGIWVIFVTLMEFVRLAFPAFNRRLLAPFRSFHRREEETGPSAIFYTSLGCWVTIFLFGQNRLATETAFLFLSFGDAAAALVGKIWGWGIFQLGGRRKSVSGCLACLIFCLGTGVALDLPAAALWIGSLTAMLLELSPLPFDDNLWIPVGSAWVLSTLI
ncbi:MAG: hypothetical protein HY400_03790 [Elusimicrobia bacterium]|nr:hypothetical protein [Elusimicrobiota bacterium]